MDTKKGVKTLLEGSKTEGVREQGGGFWGRSEREDAALTELEAEEQSREGRRSGAER